MLLKEFRIIMPLTVEEYQTAQLFSVAEVSKANTGGGEGIEVLKNEPYSEYPLLGDKYDSGRYTHKIYHMANRVPPFIRLIAPKGSLDVHEHAWNGYPYCRTVISNPGFFKDNFLVSIESLHLDDSGDQENVHELPPEKLKMREVIYVDIANDYISPREYIASEDPTIFHSVKTGRGPLVGEDWKNNVQPLMTCYKLVTCNFKFFGLQNRVEHLIQRQERRLFTQFHRQVFCWMDRWYGLTMEDIRQMEEETKKELDLLRHQGDVRGFNGTSDEL